MGSELNETRIMSCPVFPQSSTHARRTSSLLKYDGVSCGLHYSCGSQRPPPKDGGFRDGWSCSWGGELHTRPTDRKIIVDFEVFTFSGSDSDANTAMRGSQSRCPERVEHHTREGAKWQGQ